MALKRNGKQIEHAPTTGSLAERLPDQGRARIKLVSGKPGDFTQPDPRDWRWSDGSIIDIGGGASRLVDALLDAGFASVSVLDLSEKALEASKVRLGVRGATVDWVVADVTMWQPSQAYDVWHDRAAFHFLTDLADQAAYAECVRKTVNPGGLVIIGTFALDGPERCSGLPVVRHDADSIGQILGSSFALVETRRHEHQTPGGTIQRFQFSRFQRTSSRDH